MSIDDLAPANTKRAKDNSVRSFMLFLHDEGVSYEYVKECMQRESAVQSLVALLDKYGMHLAFKEGWRGKSLARHSVMQYFRQVKNWLLDQHPQLRTAAEGRLLKMGRTLEKFCMKREHGGFTNKAPACAKSALKNMVMYLYAKATSPIDYQDAALLCVLWYLFGRASDVALVPKQNLSISAGDVFFLRLIHMMTSEEQGLSLFPDDDFAACPILTLSLALASQVAPSPAIFVNLPEQLSSAPAAAIGASAPLLDLFDHPEELHEREAANDEPRSSIDSGPGIHSYVNRLLERVAKRVGVEESLTSRSFRRGGAQRANSSAALSTQLVFDRGAWNMTTTSKAFAYVFNTPSEDTKVAKVLSGKAADDHVPLTTLELFNAQSWEKIKCVMTAVFSVSHNPASPHLNVTAKVLEVLMAQLLRHYASLRSLNADAIIVRRLEECAMRVEVTKAEILAWASELCIGKQDQATRKRKRVTSNDVVEEHPVFQQQAVLVELHIEMNKLLDRRLIAMEAAAAGKEQGSWKPTVEGTVSEPGRKRRKAASASNLNDVWCACYAHAPRLWSTTSAELQKKKSDAKMIVAFVKLFAGDDGFVLDEASASYRDDVLQLGRAAEQRVRAFLAECGVVLRGAGAVLKHMRQQHKAGELNDIIAKYKRLVAAGRIVDPCPAHTNSVLCSQ